MSAAVSTSEYLMLISCWPRPNSPLDVEFDRIDHRRARRTKDLHRERSGARPQHEGDHDKQDNSSSRHPSSRPSLTVLSVKPG